MKSHFLQGLATQSERDPLAPDSPPPAPAFPATPAAMPPAVPAAGPAAERPRRVLLVEDHHDTLRIMARVLKGLGYAVLTASTVAEALAAIEREDFDLLLSDIGLPDGTGLDVMRAVRLHPARNATRGVALSGFGHDDDIRRSREAGFEEHLVKPVSVQVLEGMLKRYTA